MSMTYYQSLDAALYNEIMESGVVLYEPKNHELSLIADSEGSIYEVYEVYSDLIGEYVKCCTLMGKFYNESDAKDEAESLSGSFGLDLGIVKKFNDPNEMPPRKCWQVVYHPLVKAP